MSKSNVNTNKISGLRIAVMVISILLLSCIMAFSVLLGVSSLKRNSALTLDPDATTFRKAVPTDGTLPTGASAIDNIGYMAYVMDHQDFYHAYAYNSTKSTGYEQITQSWKDYKSAGVSGEGYSVMIASDLSYSALVKSSTQSCFIGDYKAMIRSGNKPSSKNTTPLDLEWSSGVPTIYDKNGYKYVYGEFSTEISVYVINQDTLTSADPVVDNGDGTYSQTYYLNENAGVWYQYGMKTRGGLKNFPEFKKIEITFTFDKNWQIIESYCEERATISPRALGGMDMSSNSVTTTKFYYNEESIDDTHYSYFTNTFKKYVDYKPGEGGGPQEEETDVLTVLGNGFAKVLSEDGQQFSLDVTVGGTDYDGKIYLKIPNMGDVLGSIDARVELAKKGTGKQDLYIEFKKGVVNVYYSTDFALTADINEISESVSKFIDWVNGLKSPATPQTYAVAVADEGSGLDIAALMDALKLDEKENEAIITLKSDNLLGLGLGVDAVLGFNKTVEEDGSKSFSVKSVDLNYIKYNGTKVDVKAAIVPDDNGDIITRNATQTPANLADYIDSVYNILNSNTVKVNLNLSDKLIEGLTLNAIAYVAIGSEIAGDVEISAQYQGISLKLEARYVYEGAYGKIYLHVTEINGKKVDAKVYCDIGDTVTTISDIIDIFNGGNGGGEDQTPSGSVDLAEIVNKVLNLNFAKIIGNVKSSADGSSISLDINVDELLKGLDVSIGIEFGKASLSFDSAKEIISGTVSDLGLSIDISGSDSKLAEIDKQNYVDIGAYLDGVYQLLLKPSYDIALTFNGTKLNDSIDLSNLSVIGTATVEIKDGTIRVQLPVTIRYDDYGVSLTAYYTVDLNNANKGYNEVYLHVTSLTLAGTEKTISAKVYCNVENIAQSVQAIIEKFAPKAEEQDGGISVASEQASIISKAVAIILNLDYNEVIHATNEKLCVTVDLDKILSDLDISLGVELGELKLEFTPAKGELKGSLENLGLLVTLTGNDEALGAFDFDGYVDLGIYLESIEKLLDANSYNLELKFVGGNGNIKQGLNLTGLSLDVKAQLAFTDEYKGVNVNISEITLRYNDLSIVLSAFYEVTFGGDYGAVYLKISKVNGRDVSAKVYIDINDTIDSIKSIINSVSSSTPQTYADEREEVSVIGKVIDAVLKLDFNEILHVTNGQADLTLDLDALLSELGLDIELGVLNLTYKPAEGTLTGSDTTLGIERISLGGSADYIDVLDEEAKKLYVDVASYLEKVASLLNKSSYSIEVSLEGKDLGKIDLAGLSVNGTATVAIDDGIIRVALPATVKYGDDYGVKLTAYYTVNIAERTYSTVYLHITSLTIEGKTKTISAKVYCDIKEAVPTVKAIIDKFTPKNNNNNDDNNENGNQDKDNEVVDGSSLLAKAVEALLYLNYNEIISATNELITVTVDVDKVLKDLDLSLGGITFGELYLEFVRETGTLTGKLEDLGLTVTVTGNDKELDAFDLTGYVDLGLYLDSVNSLLNANSYNLELHFVGNGNIKQGLDLTGLILDAEVQFAFTVGDDGMFNGVNVNISKLYVEYKGASVLLSAYYEVGFGGGLGTVYLVINEVNKNPVNAKGYLEVDGTIDGVTRIIGMFTNPVFPTSEGGDNGGSSVIAKIINGLLNLNFNEILKVTNKKAEVIDLDLDTLLAELNLGITLGTVSLTYIPAPAEDEWTLSGSDTTIGLNSIKLNASTSNLAVLSEDEKNAYADLNEFINSVEKLLQNSVYEISLSFSGAEIAGIDLNDLTVSAKGYVMVENNYNNITVCIPMTISYGGLAVELTAYYTADIANKDYTNVYLKLTQIADTRFSVKLYSNINDTVKAVKEIVDLFKPSNAGDNTRSGDEGDNGGLDIISAVVGVLVNINYAEIIKDTQNSLSVSLNVDNIIKELLGADLGNVTLGNLQLSLTQKDGKDAVLKGSLENLNAGVTLSGSTETSVPALSEEEKASYLDLTEVVCLVKDMIREGKNIADAKDIVFSINAEIDGADAEIQGIGEVIWKDDTIKVAVNLSVKVAQDEAVTEEETAKKYETFEVTFIYDGSVGHDSSDPFIYIAVDGHWTKISYKDINDLVNSIKNLMNALSDGTSAQAYSVAPVALEGDGETGEGDEPDLTIPGILGNGNVKKVLNAILGLINKFTVDIVNVQEDDAQQAIYNLLINYSDDITVTLGADGCLSLGIKAGDSNVTASAEAGKGTTFAGMLAGLIENEEGERELSKFIRELYDRLFGEIDKALEEKLSKLLGGSYAVELKLIGANSAISELENVDVTAKLYYGDGVQGTERTTKLIRADLTLSIGGTDVEAYVIYSASSIFIELSKIGETSLDGIKFKADMGSIYDAVEQLVTFITHPDLVNFINKIKGNGTSVSEVSALSTLGDTNDGNGNGAPSKLTELLKAVLTLNLDEAFKFSKVTDEETGEVTYKAEINIDSISQALLGVDFGTVSATLNKDSKVLDASVKLEDKQAWITLTANPETVERETVDPNDYLDIGFISTLLSDFSDVLIGDDDVFNTLYTFSGSFTVSFVRDILDVNFKNAKLTAGLNDGKFYVSLTASLESIALSNSNICFTFADGLIVLGRDIDNESKAVYKVLTMDYLLDNLFEGDEILKWYLGIGNLLWPTIKGLVPTDGISGGLPKPGTYYLYETDSGKGDEDNGEKKFSLSDYLLGLDVRTDGYHSSYGDASTALSQLGLDNDSNHYVFDINAEALVGNMIPTLYAGLLRNDSGISGIKAYGKLSTFATFTVDLTNITESEGTEPAINYLTHVTDKYKFNANFYEGAPSSAHKSIIFGSYTTGKVSKYAPSYVLDTVTLEVYNSDGSLDKQIDMVYGSTVYLIDPEADLYLDEAHEHRFAYVDSHGANLGYVIVVQDEYSTVTNLSIDQDNVARIYASSVTTVDVELIYLSVVDDQIGSLTHDIHILESVWVGDPIVLPEGVSFEGYSFAGWFRDASLTIPLTSVPSGKLAYGKFVESRVEEDGVVYEFNSDEKVMGYYVSGTNSDISKYYYGDGSKTEYPWLVIKSQINGCDVKYIASGAFYNKNANTADSLVNVIVPETVKAVYNMAFRDNKALQKVVFLGNEIFFGGRADKEDNKSSVFYGCYTSVSKDNINTNFKVYTHYHNYGNASEYVYDPYGIETYYKDKDTGLVVTDSEWHRIYFKSGWPSDTKYYLTLKDYNDPDDITREKDWAFAEYVFDFSAIDLNTYSYFDSISVFSYGIDSVVRTQSEIADEAIKQINIKTAENHNFIDGFEVSVSGSTQLGKYTRVVITVTEAPVKAYKVHYNLEGNAYLDGAITKDYLKGSFATEGETYYVVPKDGYAITSLNFAIEGVVWGEVEDSEDGRYYFVMPAEFTEFETVCKANFKKITLNSDIPFTFLEDDKNYDSAVTVDKQAEEAMVKGATAQEGYSEYVFIGWAYYDGKNYVLEGDKVNYSVYYAIWAVKREGIERLTVSGKTLTANVSSDIDSVYGWYGNEDFNGSADEKCNNNSATFTKVSSRILHARFNYTLFYSISGGADSFFYFNDSDRSKKSDIVTAVYNSSLIIMEGSTVEFSLGEYVNDTKNDVIGYTLLTITYNDGTKLLIRANKVDKGLFGSTSVGKMRAFALPNGEVSMRNENVRNNLSFTATY